MLGGTDAIAGRLIKTRAGAASQWPEKPGPFGALYKSASLCTTRRSSSGAPPAPAIGDTWGMARIIGKNYSRTGSAGGGSVPEHRHPITDRIAAARRWADCFRVTPLPAPIPAALARMGLPAARCNRAEP